MAVKEKERDEEDDGDESPKKAKKASGPVRLIIVGAVALFVAVLGAQVAAPLLTQMISGGKSPAAKSSDDEEQLASAEPAADGAEAQPDVPLEPALYTPLDPPFVVSFNDKAGDTRFVQLTLQAMARKQKTIDAIKQHSPAIRNAFLFLISGYKVEDLETVQGKEKLRKEMLAAANDILVKNTGSADMEDLYFTSLVIQ